MSQAVEGQPGNIKRIGAAGLIGTMVEFYDLQIYTTAAALVFARVFFPELGTVQGTVAAFGTFGVAFVARPLGSIVFGHFGDRLGRKRMLVTTLALMGISTVCVGLLPTGEQIGIAAPVLLVILRVIQGFAAGGEWAGAALFVAESAPQQKRGFMTMLPVLGGSIALSLAGLTFLLIRLVIDDAQFLAWGWRIPFLLAGVALIVGLYIRMNLPETPVFDNEVRKHGTVKAPLIEAFRQQPREMLLGAMLPVPAYGLLYLALTYLAGFAMNDLGLSYIDVLYTTVGSGIMMSIGMIVTSSLSDRFGRRTIMLVALAVATLWALVLFPLVAIGTAGSYFTGALVSALVAGFCQGPVAALMSELFRTQYRYTAFGLCYNAAGILGGGLPPVIAGVVVASYGPVAFSALLAGIFLLSFLSCLALPETRKRNLENLRSETPAPARS